MKPKFQKLRLWVLEIATMKQSEVDVISKLFCHDFTGLAHLEIDFPPCGP